MGNHGGLDLDLFDNSKKPLDVPLSIATPTSTQYIKQELRNICTARSERQMQTQGMTIPSPQYSSLQQQQQQHHHQQQQQQQQQLQPMESNESVSEIPLEILEQIHEMSAEHGLPSSYKEDVILPKKREEAKSRYEQFRALANTEDPEEKASSLFRKQLTSQQQYEQQQQQQSRTVTSDSLAMFKDPPTVNIVVNEPRAPVEDIKPANQKDSLLQKLLSD